MRVPADATSGKAFIRFELPKDCGHESTQTELAVELVAAEKKN
jgi:hypothetical protein